MLQWLLTSHHFHYWENKIHWHLIHMFLNAIIQQLPVAFCKAARPKFSSTFQLMAVLQLHFTVAFLFPPFSLPVSGFTRVRPPAPSLQAPPRAPFRASHHSGVSRVASTGARAWTALISWILMWVDCQTHKHMQLHSSGMFKSADL